MAFSVLSKGDGSSLELIHPSQTPQHNSVNRGAIDQFNEILSNNGLSDPSFPGSALQFAQASTLTPSATISTQRATLERLINTTPKSSGYGFGVSNLSSSARASRILNTLGNVVGTGLATGTFWLNMQEPTIPGWKETTAVLGGDVAGFLTAAREHILTKPLRESEKQAFEAISDTVPAILESPTFSPQEKKEIVYPVLLRLAVSINQSNNHSDFLGDPEAFLSKLTDNEIGPISYSLTPDEQKKWDEYKKANPDIDQEINYNSRNQSAERVAEARRIAMSGEGGGQAAVAYLRKDGSNMDGGGNANGNNISTTGETPEPESEPSNIADNRIIYSFYEANSSLDVQRNSLESIFLDQGIASWANEAGDIFVNGVIQEKEGGGFKGVILPSLLGSHNRAVRNLNPDGPRDSSKLRAQVLDKIAWAGEMHFKLVNGQLRLEAVNTTSGTLKPDASTIQHVKKLLESSQSGFNISNTQFSTDTKHIDSRLNDDVLVTKVRHDLSDKVVFLLRLAEYNLEKGRVELALDYEFWSIDSSYWNEAIKIDPTFKDVRGQLNELLALIKSGSKNKAIHAIGELRQILENFSIEFTINVQNNPPAEAER